MLRKLSFLLIVIVTLSQAPLSGMSQSAKDSVERANRSTVKQEVKKKAKKTKSSVKKGWKKTKEGIHGAYDSTKAKVKKHKSDDD